MERHEPDFFRIYVVTITLPRYGYGDSRGSVGR